MWNIIVADTTSFTVQAPLVANYRGFSWINITDKVILGTQYTLQLGKTLLLILNKTANNEKGSRWKLR